MFINLWCCYLDNALVRTSATMCSVGQYSNRTSPFSIRSWTKWCVVHQFVLFVHGEWDSWSTISHLDCRIESPSLSSPPCILNPSSILLSIRLLLWLACSPCISPLLWTMLLQVVVYYSKKWLHLQSWKKTMWWTFYLQDHHPNPHHNIQTLPWMVLHRIAVSFATYLANIERFVWRPSNAPC